MTSEYWLRFEELANRVIPDFDMRTVALLLAGLVIVGLIFGIAQGGPVAVLSALFLAFLGIPAVIIFRHFDERSIIEIEEIVLKAGTATHTQFATPIKKAGTYTTPDGRTFEPGDLFGDKLKRKKWVLYFLHGYRARALVIYKGDEKTPIKFTSPTIPGEILHKAYTTVVLRKALAETFTPRAKFGSILLIIGLVIVLLLIASWVQAGGISFLKGVF